MRLAARYDSDAAHTITSSIRRYAAVDTESPTPVPIATYAARHRDGAERASAPAPHDTRSARRLSRSLCRSRRPRSNDERSRVVLLRTATRTFAGHVAPRRIDEAAGGISVVMASPVAQVVVRTGLVAALRRDVEEDVGAEKHVAAARVARIGMEDAAVLVLVEHAAAGHFLALEFLRCVVVIHLALRALRERYVIVVVEIALIRRHPLEAPAHAFLERLDL